MSEENGLLVQVFTHPACSGCGRAVEMAWDLTQEFDDLKIETVKLENKKGLKTAHSVGIKTIPTLIYYRGSEEKERFVGLPTDEEFKNAYLKLSRKRA